MAMQTDIVLGNFTDQEIRAVKDPTTRASVEADDLERILRTI